MRSRKKHFKRKKSKIKIVTDKLFHAVKISAEALSETGKLYLRKCGKAPGKFTGAVKHGFHRYTQMPLYLRIVSAYLLTLLLVGGVFIWRTAQLKSVNPDTTQWPFEWTDDWEHLIGSDGSGEEQNGEDLEPATSPPDSVPEKADQEPEKTDTPASETVFAFGKWPVQGAFFYDYGDRVEDHTVPYTSHTTSKGIALEADAGTVFVASWDGTVTAIKLLDYPHGKSVTIQHGFGLTVYYGALDKVFVQVGEPVRQGDPIGTVVAPGFETEPSYLYLRVLQDGKPVDPKSKFLPL